MAAAIDADTRLVFLCSPNNPTGHIISQREAERFMDRVPPHVVVVFDESYFEYVDDPEYADSLGFLHQGRAVLIVRSFSKAGGLANMRIGYLIGPAELAQYVSRAKAPFHTGDVSLAAALASLDDADFIARQTQAVQAGRRYLYDALSGLGLHCLPSQANFVAFYDPPLPAEALTAALLRRGFIVRAMAGFGMPNAIRVSVGSPEENAGFIAALTALLATLPASV
jgi:histidinol-phosphate aminotransferase